MNINANEKDFIKDKINKIKESGNNDFSWIKENLAKNKFTINDLLSNDLMTELDIDKFLISKPEHQNKINNEEYDLQKIKQLILNNIVSSDFVYQYLARNLKANPAFMHDIVNSGLLRPEEIDTILITKTEHENKLNKGEYDLQKIKQLLSNNIINFEIITEYLKAKVKKNTAFKDEIINANIFTASDIDKLLIDKYDHVNNIKDGTYSTEDTKRLLGNNIITEADLVNGGFTDDDVSLILGRAKTKLETPDIRIEDIPPLVKKRTDIFVFGLPGSGKSTFMASLIYYAVNKADAEITLEKTNTNNIGQKYAHVLDQSIKEERLLAGNPTGDLQYMTIDFLDKKDRTHPLTFFEMAGEDFEQFYDQTTHNVHPKMREYLITNPNQKVLFMVIDSTRDTNQIYKLTNILQQLDNENTLDSVSAIAILLTKWDKNEGIDPAEYMVEKYRALYTLCARYEKKYTVKVGGFFSKKLIKKLKFRTFDFSLGEFNGDSTTYKYNDSDAKKIYTWLNSITDHK